MAKKLSRYLPGLSLGAAPQAPKKAVKQQKRNGHAFHPIMAKGGVHEKSKSAQRAAAKQQTNRKAREWLGRSFHNIHFVKTILINQKTAGLITISL